MLDLTELSHIVKLHQQSYGLLKWVAKGLMNKTQVFSIVHESMSDAEAAYSWISTNYMSFPHDVRPNELDFEDFSYLFSSFLLTSFELIQSPQKEIYSPCGCYCRLCSYLRAGRHLKLRNLTKRSREKAVLLKEIYLQELAQEHELSITPNQIREMIIDSNLKKDISAATYGFELIRRTEFTSQGLSVLALWREIAWNNGSLNVKFRLEADQLIDSESKILDYMLSNFTY